MKFWASKRAEAPDFQSTTSEFEIANFVDQAESLKNPAEVLAILLDEKHTMYKDRGSNQVIRLQGYILASLHKHGLNSKSLLIALETLENSRSAYLVAAAAKALNGMEKPNPHAVAYLVSAIENVYYNDDRVTFEKYAPQWPLENSTTALNEIFLSLQKLAPVAENSITKLESWLTSKSFNAKNEQELVKTIEAIRNTKQLADDCCDDDISENKSFLRISRKNLLNLKLQDQDGDEMVYQEFFTGKPTVLVFFYTRCTNHNKCSLTVSRLAQLQKMIKENGLEGKVNTAAFTYDPSHDSPNKIRLYGLQRHVEFSPNDKFFKIVEEEKMSMVFSYFDSSVNFIGSLVNKHQLELYILDPKGRPVKSFVRLRWDSEVVMNELRNQVSKKRKVLSSFRRFLSGGLSIILPILIAFFPKCPFCWAGYMTMFGISGISTIPYSPWILPVLCGLLLLNLWILWRRAVRRKYWLPFIISVVGALVLIVFGPILRMDFLNLTLVGMVLVMAGSLLNSFPIRRRKQLRFS
ncbi:MAG: SCO family protein [Crocinitomicaceae bacterium]|nr:SCO family protein [Crocinitomicaceae bacterium]